jgi:Zn-dependent M16 (insulinase) family peptidase
LNFDDLKRLRQLVLEYRAGLEAAVIHNGHRLAMSLAARNFTPTNYLQEVWGGIHQLHTIKQVAQESGSGNLQELAANLKAIGAALFGRENARLAIVGETERLNDAAASIQALTDALPSGGRDGFEAPRLTMPAGLPREGWCTGTAVSFVAQTFQTVPLGHADSPALAVIAKMLRSMYLHREIREKGGAYGGFSIYNPEDGLFGFGSYRDPHIVGTLNAYRGAVDFIRAGHYTEEDVKEAILQVCSEIDKPDSPGPAARKAFYRRIIGLADETRLRHKQQLLTLDRQAVLETAERYFDNTSVPKAVAVISSRDRLEAANQQLGGQALSLYTV